MLMIDKIKLKLASWKGTLLLVMGHLLLVKLVIQGLLLYSFKVYPWPMSFIKSIDYWICNFIWSGDIYHKKLVIVA